MFSLALCIILFSVCSPVEARLGDKDTAAVQDQHAEIKEPEGEVDESVTQVSKHVQEEDIIEEVISARPEGEDRERVARWEAVMAPMYASLPKGVHGNLEHGAARYALHRSFLKERQWTVAGLEPNAQTEADNSSSTQASMKEWMPTYLLDMTEELMGTDGINLQELALIAATVEDLVHEEAVKRLKDVYKQLHLPIDKLVGEELVDKAISTYMTMYTRAAGKHVTTASEVEKQHLDLDSDTQLFLMQVRENVTTAEFRCNAATHNCELDFPGTSRVMEEVGRRYGAFKNAQCRDLKSELLKLEDSSMLGHVPLAEFHRHGFKDGIDHLRELGALDETWRNEPRVSVPNYISSEASCVTSSSFYKVCCRSECEDLMDRLEQKAGGVASIMKGNANAEPSRVVELVEEMLADAGEALRTVSQEQRVHLERMAASYGGLVPLHSHQFGLFMHRVFPRECPTPHYNSEHPQTPGEWMTMNQHEKEQKTTRRLAMRKLSTSTASPSSASVKEAPWQQWNDEVKLKLGKLRLNGEAVSSMPQSTENAKVGKRRLTVGSVPQAPVKHEAEEKLGKLRLIGEAPPIKAEARKQEWLANLHSSGEAKVTVDAPKSPQAGKRMRLGAASREIIEPLVFDAEEEVEASREEEELEASREASGNDLKVPDYLHRQEIEPELSSTPTHGNTKGTVTEVLGYSLWKLAPLMFFTVLLSGAVVLNFMSKSDRGKKYEDPSVNCDERVIMMAAVTGVRQRGACEQAAVCSV